MRRGISIAYISLSAVLAVSCSRVSEDSSRSTSPDAEGYTDNDVDSINNIDDGDTEENGSDNDPDSDVSSGGWDPSDNGTVVVLDGGVLITEGDGTVFACYETVCDGRVLECGDCRDNDADGKTDWRDRECLGPCDNTEGAALIAGVGGVTGSTCHVDCYFDYGNGMGPGSDDCWWDHQCDPLEPEAELCPYDERLTDNQKFCPDVQSPQCEEICLPFTPNGCDCFGCCTFPELDGLGQNGEEGYVWIGAMDESFNGTCTFADITNPDKCPPCTPIPNCLNECGHCELCIGKTTLPPDCFDASDTDGDVPDDMCPDGILPCGLEGLEECAPGYYCVSGCCQPTTILV